MHESKTRRDGSAGFTLLEIMIVVAIIAFLATFVGPAVESARRRANESAAIATLKVIHGSQEQFRISEHPTSLANGFAPSLQALEAMNLLPGNLLEETADGTVYRHGGYLYYTFGGDITASEPEQRGLVMVAWPRSVGRTGERSFLRTEDGRLYVRDDGVFFFVPTDGRPLEGL